MFRKLSSLPLAALAVIGSFVVTSSLALAQEPPPPAPEPKVVEITGKPPLEVLKDRPLGTMKSPYAEAKPELIEEGKKLYFSYSCNGCHGGGGGGGMCPPLTNDTWVYGAGDDILYRLITEGSQDLQKTHSLKRKGQEGVVGPMPPFGALIKTDDEVWKIIAYIRSLYKGSRKLW